MTLFQKFSLAIKLICACHYPIVILDSIELFNNAKMRVMLTYEKGIEASQTNEQFMKRFFEIRTAQNGDRGSISH